MAWYNSGTWEGLPIVSLSEIAAELCCAISERGAAVWPHAITWTCAGGATYPTASDFDGYEVQRVGVIVAEMQSKIDYYFVFGLDAAVCFVDPTTHLPFSDSADILEHTSYGTSWLTPGHACDPRPWLQIKEAVEYIYRISVSLISYTNVLAKYTRDGIDGGTAPATESDFQNAWDNMLADSETYSEYLGVSGTSPNAYWIYTYSESTTYLISMNHTRRHLRLPSSFSWSYGETNSVPIVASYMVIRCIACAQYSGDPISIDIEGETIECDTPGTSYSQTSMGTSWREWGEDFYPSMTNPSEPATKPFSGLPTAGDWATLMDFYLMTSRDDSTHVNISRMIGDISSFLTYG